MKNRPHKISRPVPKDALGMPLRQGDVVKILAAPHLLGMSRRARAESQPVFEYLVGRYKKIAGFNEFGMAEIVFSTPLDRRRGSQVVWLETHLLRKRIRKKP